MIPQGMALQKSLTEKEEQMLFTGAGPKTKPKIVGEPNRKKREKKGSNNLATFGVQNPESPSLQDCMEILKEGKENREKCCERLIEAGAIGKGARETGEFDKVCSDCENCGEEVPE